MLYVLGLYGSLVRQKGRVGRHCGSRDHVLEQAHANGQVDDCAGDFRSKFLSNPIVDGSER